MWLLAALQKRFPKKFRKKLSYSDTIEELQAVRLATLFKRHPRSGFSEPAVCRFSTK